MLPAFEEEGAAPFDPRPVARTVLDEHSAQGEQCRILGTRLVALGRDKRLRRIGVVGSGAGEGTTTVALGLARALSRDHKRRVLLLELDLRHPTLDHELGLEPPASGLRQYLAGRCDVPVLRRSRPSGFWVLSAGGGAASSGPVPPPRGSRPSSARPIGSSTTWWRTVPRSSKEARVPRCRTISTGSSSWCARAAARARRSSGPPPCSRRIGSSASS